MTAATATRGVPGASPPGFTSTLASEWVKLKSVRSTYIQTALALILGIGMTALVALAIGSTFQDLSPQDQATFDPESIGFIGAAFGQIVLTVFGVTFVSSEYTSGMIRQTLTTTPRRWQVVLTKALIITAVTLLIGVVISFVAFFVGQAVLGNYEGVPTTSLEGDAMRAVVLGGLTTPLFPLIGGALGVILRSTASAITTVLSIIFVPGIFGALLPDTFQRNILRFLPGNATDQLTVTADADSPLYLDVAPAIALVVFWLVAFGAAAVISVTRRDV